MGSSDALGSAETAVLRALADRPGGAWTTDDLPLWDNRYWTLQLLNKLAKRGLVTEVTAGRVFRLDEAVYNQVRAW